MRTGGNASTGAAPRHFEPTCHRHADSAVGGRVHTARPGTQAVGAGRGRVRGCRRHRRGADRRPAGPDHAGPGTCHRYGPDGPGRCGQHRDQPCEPDRPSADSTEEPRTSNMGSRRPGAPRGTLPASGQGASLLTGATMPLTCSPATGRRTNAELRSPPAANLSLLVPLAGQTKIVDSNGCDSDGKCPRSCCGSRVPAYRLATASAGGCLPMALPVSAAGCLPAGAPAGAVGE